MGLYRKLAFAIAVFFIFIIGGSLAYSYIEGWGYIDSTYFTVATLTTVGYEDFVPQTDNGKIFTIFFSFFGIGMALYFFTLSGKYIYRKQLSSHLKEFKRIKENKETRAIKNKRK